MASSPRSISCSISACTSAGSEFDCTSWSTVGAAAWGIGVLGNYPVTRVTKSVTQLQIVDNNQSTLRGTHDARTHDRKIELAQGGLCPNHGNEPVHRRRAPRAAAR